MLRHSVGEEQRVIKPLPDLILALAVLKCHRSQRPLLLHGSTKMAQVAFYSRTILSEALLNDRTEKGEEGGRGKAGRQLREDTMLPRKVLTLVTMPKTS